MEKKDVYLYGMILFTNSFLLKDAYPLPDTYGEISGRYSLPGGETGTATTVLANLGCSIVMDGTYMGRYTYPKILEFYKDKQVDTTKLYFDESFEGLQDYVLIDKDTRTTFGTFNQYYSDGFKRWNNPTTEDIIAARVVGLDPWFYDKTQKVVNICKENHIPYVTIDCPYDSDTHRYSSINVISNEFVSANYPDMDRTELFHKYIEQSNGLVIFTLGPSDILYGRKGDASPLPKQFQPYRIEVVSTLGAGDSFKAGCIYALLNQMKDEETVSFAAATAACACTVFPLPLNPPSLEKIELMQKSRP